MRILYILGLAAVTLSIACQDTSAVKTPPKKPEQSVASCIEEICDRNIAWGKTDACGEGRLPYSFEQMKRFFDPNKVPDLMAVLNNPKSTACDLLVQLKKMDGAK